MAPKIAMEKPRLRRKYFRRVFVTKVSPVCGLPPDDDASRDMELGELKRMRTELNVEAGEHFVMTNVKHLLTMAKPPRALT